MSIDVFGRQFKRAEAVSLGPPGIGFKLTLDEQYDIENKKLCNVAEAQDTNDAVNLNLIQRMIQKEMQTIYDVTATLRNEIMNNNVMIKNMENFTNNTTKVLKIDLESLKELVSKNAELISKLDVELKALENEH